MTLALAGSLFGIALVDSLNPSLFIAQFVLFATRKPVPRIVAYLAGVLAANFAGGIVFVAGLRVVLETFVRDLDPRAGFGTLLLVGLGLLIFGLVHKAEPATPETRERKPPLSLWKAFLFGIVVMVQELTTALPLVVAAERITAADMGWGANLLALAFYNLIFALPLFAFLGAFVLARRRFTEQIARITTFINTWGPRVFKWISLVIGIGLVGYAGVNLFNLLTVG